MKKILAYLSKIIFVFMFVLLVYLFLNKTAGHDPSLFGYHLYRISSGSMEPVYMVGDIIVVKETDVSELMVGDDITYLSKEGVTEGLLITHRIISEPAKDEEGTYHLGTMGVAVGAVPDPIIVDDQVIGKVVHASALISFIYSIFLTKWGLLFLMLPLVYLIFCEIKNIVYLLNEGENQDENQE